MACAITTQWGNHVYWTPPDRDDISHYIVCRRTDEVAPVATADVVAHVPFVIGTASSPHYFDPFTAINTITAYTYWVKSVAWDGKSSALSLKITATSSPSAIQTSIYTNGTAILSNLTICNALTVCGVTTLTGNISVSGTLHVSNAVTLGSTLNVSGAVSLSSTLWVCGSTTLNGLTVSGTATIGNLDVTANISVTGTLNVCGAVTLNGVSSDLTIGNNNVKIGTACSTITIEGKGISFVSSGNVTITSCGNLTVDTNINICGYATVEKYIGFTSTTTVIVTAPGAGVRLFGKDSGGLTKLMIVDSAGTELQIGTGGGGNAVYIEAENSAAVDTTGADINLVFDTASFTIAVNGQCATITTIGGAGNAIYVEADGAPQIDNAAADSYLVFDSGIFSSTTTGQCAVITITADGIDDTLIDWGYAAGQVGADDIPIGSASDSSWADGIMAWTDDTTVAAALDDINETLSYLAPDDAIALSGSLNGYVSFGGAAITKYAGRLSDGNINYKGADPAGTSVSYIIKSAPFTMTTPSGNMFNKADEGDTCYYHAVAAVAYGAAERRVSHTAVFSESDRAGSQSASTVAAFTTAELSVNYVAWYNSFPKWQVGSAYVTISSGMISRGYNRYKITRECGFVTQLSSDFEIFYDSAALTPVVGTTTVTENVPVLKKLSGVRMYDRGSTWLVDLDSANQCFDNVYRNTYIFAFSSTSSLLGAAANLDYNTSKVTGASTPPACGDTLKISGYQTTTPNANNRSSNARASFTAYNVYGSTDVDTSPSANRLVDSYAQTSGNLVEYFDDEIYRMSAGADFDDKTLTIVNVWTGSKTLVDGEAQVYGGSLIYPSTNFNAGYLPAGQSADYSAFAANQVYCRAIYDSTTTPHSNGSIEIGNLVLADVDPVGTGDVNVELKFPTQTGWLDLGTAYNAATFTGVDGDGCRVSQSGDDWVWTCGTFSTGNSGDRYYVRVTIRNSAKSLTQIRELGW